MPATAYQLPFVKDGAAQTGRKLFRIQVLPKGTVPHPAHGDLAFTDETLQELAENFKAGAMDQVPFLIADGERDHPRSGGDPDRFRGEVKGLELSDDGLYATVEATDRGAQMLGDNPRLPVSVRLKVPEAGPFAGKQVLAHVLGTLDPVATGMRKWEQIDASDDVNVIDLSERQFTTGSVSTDAPSKGTDALSTDEKNQLVNLLAKVRAEETDDKPPEFSDEEIQAAVDALVKAAEEDANGGDDTEPSDTPKEPATASLSDEDRKVLDMANERVDRADCRAGRAEIDSRLKDFADQGVPPYLLDVAREQLLGDTDEHKRIAIDFANERKPFAVTAAFAMLEKAKGTIDFAEEGTTVLSDGESDEEKQAEALANDYFGRGGS